MASAPYRRLLVLGDSIAYGMCAHEPNNEWHQVAATLPGRLQANGPTVFNRGLPAGVISPRCPGYDESAKPSLLEHYEEFGIALDRDLLIIAEGLNDMRSGMSLQEYAADLETIARHDAALAAETFRTIEAEDVSILNTGGTDTDDTFRTSGQRRWRGSPSTSSRAIRGSIHACSKVGVSGARAPSTRTLGAGAAFASR